MKKTKPTKIAILFAASALAAPLTALAQTTVFSDDFATDSSLASSYVNINNIGGSDEWSFATGTGLTLTTAATGKVDELVGSFSPVTLAQTGDYISFIVGFNSANIVQTSSPGSNDGGSLLASLNYSGGTPLGSTSPLSPTATTGSTAGYVGYLGNIALNSTPKTGTKFFAKTGAGNNDLAYNSDATPDTQVGTTQPNGNNAILANNTAYTLTYTITALNAGASEESITATIAQGANIVDSYTLDATSGSSYVTPSSTYDTFDVGIYTGSEAAGYDVNVTSSEITTDVVPEPSTLALAGLGIIGFGFMRQMRRS